MTQGCRKPFESMRRMVDRVEYAVIFLLHRHRDTVCHVDI